MAQFNDLSGNGKGVLLDPQLGAIDLSVTDAVVPNKANYIRANGAGNVIVRVPGGTVDVTIPAKDGEYIPMSPGAIIRKTGTSVTSLVAIAG